MNPSNDPLYKIHRQQSRGAGKNPLPYAEFCSRLEGTYEHDLGDLLRAKDTSPVQPTPKLALGELCITANAANTIPREDILQGLRKHARGDWGELGAHDTAQNERALRQGGRICSRYILKTGEPFWIITEADRSMTTVLLPEDY